jgi:hypothetical protein
MKKLIACMVTITLVFALSGLAQAQQTAPAGLPSDSDGYGG